VRNILPLEPAVRFLVRRLACLRYRRTRRDQDAFDVVLDTLVEQLVGESP